MQPAEPGSFAGSLDRARRQFLAGDRADAAALCRRLLDQAFETGAPGRTPEPQAVADAATLLVRISRREEQFDEAFRWANVALTAALACGDARRECLARVQHARLLSVLGQTDEALAESYAALRAAIAAGEARDEAAGLEALADVQWSMSQWDDALASYKRMLQLAEDCGDLELQAVAHGGLGGMNHHLGSLAVDAGSHEAAQAHFRVAGSEAQAFLRCAQAVGDTYNVRMATHNHAVALLGLGDTAAARAVLQPLLSQWSDREQVQQAFTVKNLGDVDFEDGRFQDALARVREALALADAAGQPNLSMECCEALAKTCEAVGDPAGALAYHRRFHELYVQVASQSAQARARAMSVKYDTERAHAVALAQRSRADRLESSNTSLSLEAERLVRMSFEDALTGIGNRRLFEHTVQSADTEDDTSRPCSLALLDLDRFKAVNDAFSHAIGDAVLRRVGAILAANSRRGDIAARYGGEEFALFLSGLDPIAARQVCERVRLAVASENWAALNPRLRVTVSIGLAHRTPGAQGSPLRELVELADRRLYAAKHAGRNRVVDTDGEAGLATRGD